MSVDIKFPQDPENGTIFEVIPGVFYKYNSGSNCWAKLKGVDSLGLATPLSNGLMSKEDFTKLQNLIIPPPQSTLKGEECETVFKSGIVALYSFDESVGISKNPKVINKTPDGLVDATGPWQLHKNTAGFDFRIPINRIVQEIEERNRLKKVQLQGNKGGQGKRGGPGEDRLDTGPIGEKGEAGTNSPFSGILVSESIPFELAPGSNNRAVVDIDVEEVSEDENYLVVTRANIGNPDACPTLVTPKDFNSALVVALNVISGGKLVKDQTVTSGDCALICRICASSVHHLNIDEIVCAIFDQFVVRVGQLKLEKEALVKAWLSTMISLFSEQKASLCCALENCRSRTRNQSTRQYIETQRIQAALGDFQLIIDGDGENRQVTPMDSHKDCPVQQETTQSIVIEGDCLIANLDSKIHTTDPRVSNSNAVSSFLGPGSYTAEITGCCANFNSSVNSPAYSGHAGILYQAVISVGDGDDVQSAVEQTAVTFPDFGTFSNESAAKNAYQGVTLTFEHNGGDIAFWLIDSDGFSANNAGLVQITIKPFVEDENLGTDPDSDGVVYVYRDEVSFEGLLGQIVPFAGNISASENFGSLEDDVDLTFGPALVKDRAQVFFYEGTDGLSMFFVAGETPSSFNEQIANILVDVNISNNSLVTNVLASDVSANVNRVSADDFQAAMTVNEDSTGFAIGEFDTNSDYSIRFDPRDLSTMKMLIAADSGGENIVLAEGGSEGIGGNISAMQTNSAPLYNVSGVPVDLGGGNDTGLRINNESSGQTVHVSRPISIDVNATFGTTSERSTVILPEPEIPSTILKVVDEDFSDSNWQSLTMSSGREGSSGTTTQTSKGANLLRTTTHSTGGSARRLVSTGRPTKSFFGPGSAPALPFDQSYATDQFGNTWAFIRDVSGNPHKNGSGDTFIRDALSSETWVYGDRLAANIFPGGSSGIASGTVASSGGSDAIINTVHVFQATSWSPADGKIQQTQLNIKADRTQEALGSVFEVGSLVYQDGHKYATTTSQSVAAGAIVGVGVTAVASNFGRVESDGSISSSINPNFESGPPLLFGYYTRSMHSNPDPESITIGIDSFTYCITVDDPEGLIPPGDIPPSIIEEKGEFVGEEASSLPRGAEGSPQDPCINNITISMRSSAPQSMRYILTDKAGVKFYSAYRSIDVTKLNEFQLLSFGAPITMLDPPVEFTPSVISGKTIEVSAVASKLDTSQTEIASSLDGLARLSYIQSLLGTPTNTIPNSHNITDLEFEVRNAPFSSIDIGVVSASVGIPGAITEVLIDNFEISEVIVGQTEAVDEVVLGSVKRIVATQTGTDSSVAGLVYSGITNYFGDYSGKDTFKGARPDFSGNNFFLLNRAGDKITQVTSRRGFKNIKFRPGATDLTTVSGNVTSIDAIAVNDFGVVYVADGPAGEIIMYIAANAQIRNTQFGDVHDESSNTRVVIATGLPKVSDAVLTIGSKNIRGSAFVDEITANFGGQWFRLEGVGAALSEISKSFRADVTTLRCCFGGNPPNRARARAILEARAGGNFSNFGSGPVGTSLTTNKNANPQPGLPSFKSKHINQSAIQAELDSNFNQFSMFTLDGDTIYEVSRSTGSRTVFRELGENAFGLRAHPRTKDLYYITKDRGSTPSSGTSIRRVDIDDLDKDNDDLPRIKTVVNIDANEGIFGITFANSVPTDPTTKNQVLYALLSNLEAPNQGKTITAKLVEIAEHIVPPVPAEPISAEVPLSSTWNSSVSGGRTLGNPSKVIFSRVAPGGGCQMHYKQIQWYERGWRIGACCGALVELDGLHYIVVKRSIGTDLSCGGGESLNNACIAQFINSGEGHPAIAWPTTEPIGPPPGGGGDEFLGIPTSGFMNLVKVEALSDALLGKIKAGSSLKTIGSPAKEIPFILFPAV